MSAAIRIALAIVLTALVVAVVSFSIDDAAQRRHIEEIERG